MATGDNAEAVRHRRAAGNPRLLGLALGSALVGQYCFVGPPQNLLGGVVLYTVACAAFWRLLQQEESTPTEDDGLPGRGAVGTSSPRVRLPLLLVTLACNAAALSLLEAKPLGSGQYWEVLAWWLASILLFLTLAGAESGHPFRLRSRIEWQEWGAVTVLTALAFASRIAHLEAVPTLLAGDEAAMGLEGLRVLDGSLPNMFATGWFSHPTVFFFIQALSLRLFGATVFALRLSSALVGTCTVPLLYAFARRLWDRRVALCAAALLTTYHFHVHYSRLGLNNIEDALFAVLAFLILGRAVQCGEPLDFALCGLVLGFSQYFYWGSKVLPLVALLLVGLIAWRHRGFWRLNRGNVLLLIGAFALVVSPLALYFVQHPDKLWARPGQIGILRSGWLARTAEATGTTAWIVLGQQCIRSILAFHAFTDTSVLYGAPIPLLDYFSAVMFTFGLIYTLYRRRSWPYTLLLLWLGLVILFGGALLVDPPTSQRFVVAAPLLCLLPALGLDRLLTLAQNALEWGRALGQGLFVLIVAFMVLGNARYYFAQYTPGGYFLEANSELANRAGRYIRSLGADCRIYFVGAPRIYLDSPAITFLAGAPMGQDVLESIAGRPDWVDATRSAVFVFTPERLDELELVREHYPQGRVKEFHSDVHGPLFVAYELD